MNGESSPGDWSMVASPMDRDLAVARAWRTGRAGAAARKGADAGALVPLPGSAKDRRARDDAVSSDLGPFALYLREIRQVPLLQPTEEIALARAI